MVQLGASPCLPVIPRRSFKQHDKRLSFGTTFSPFPFIYNITHLIQQTIRLDQVRDCLPSTFCERDTVRADSELG
jgi:hypothetical protein